MVLLTVWPQVIERMYSRKCSESIELVDEVGYAAERMTHMTVWTEVDDCNQ
jgi:hypothetical protein